MNIFDAAKILKLNGNLNPETTKKAYRDACKRYHPDINPAGEEMMKVVNEAYDALKDYSGEVEEEQSDYGDLFNDALNAIFPLSGLSIEICGVWVWVTGDTIKHKEHLKGAGFKWANKKKAWFFKPAQFRSRGRGNTTLEQIRTKYGSKAANGFGNKGIASHA